MDEYVSAYLDALRAECAEVLGNDLTAVWLVGSLTMRDFDPRRSDIDVLVLSARTVAEESKQLLAQRLRHTSLRCPAYGIDLQVYLLTEVANLRRVPHYEFSLASGRAWSDEIDVGGPYPRGLIDLAAAREIGRSIFGPHPQVVIGACPDEWILQELAKSVLWHQSRIHDPFHDPSGSNAVLNACRALNFHATRRFVSKSDGARWYLERAPSAVVSKALAERQSGDGERLEEAEVLSFLGRVMGGLNSGSA